MATSPASSCRGSMPSAIGATAMAVSITNIPENRCRSPRKDAAMAPAETLLITQYYWPEPIGSAPFCVDLAEWIAGHRRRVTVLTSFPHYPNREMYRGHDLESRRLDAD